MSHVPTGHGPVETPAAEVYIDAALVQRLLVEQHPDLAALPIQALDSGWDNAMYRLGDELLVRLPRRAISAELIAGEQRWLPVLAPRLPVAIPAPIRVGRPGQGFPWPWSILPWLPGETADLAPMAANQGARLAALLRALHVTAPADAPVNPVRGVPLATRCDVVEPRIERLARSTDCITAGVVAAWRTALGADLDQRACWVHGDLHPRNVLVAGGSISAVIDWGDICVGDRATDLAAVWTLLDDPAERRRAIREYGSAPASDWLRARGWAVSFGTVLLETGLADHPAHAAIGRDILRRVEAGPADAVS